MFRPKIVLRQVVVLALLKPIPPNLLSFLGVQTVFIFMKSFVEFSVITFPVPVLKALFWLGWWLR